MDAGAANPVGQGGGQNISAVIPDYLKERLLIDAEVAGAGSDVHDYFMQTPLHDSLGRRWISCRLAVMSVGAYISIFPWTASRSERPVKWR